MLLRRQKIQRKFMADALEFTNWRPFTGRLPRVLPVVRQPVFATNPNILFSLSTSSPVPAELKFQVVPLPIAAHREAPSTWVLRSIAVHDSGQQSGKI